jgi:uncharacterized Tic20 family protein
MDALTNKKSSRRTQKQNTNKNIMMHFSTLQGASILAAHATLTKMLLSFTYRTYQFLEWDAKRRQEVADNFNLQEFQKAQINESEYAALLVSILVFLSLSADNDTSSMGATLAVIGQVGYVWMRTLVGYPKIPTITFAVIRYGGLFLLVSKLWNLGFPMDKL